MYVLSEVIYQARIYSSLFFLIFKLISNDTFARYFIHARLNSYLPLHLFNPAIQSHTLGVASVVLDLHQVHLMVQVIVHFRLLGALTLHYLL